MTKNGTRTYRTPEGVHYPSVTAMLGRTKDMSGLDVWKKSVGEDVAAYILSQAGAIGTATHGIIERHLRNMDCNSGTVPLLAQAHFANIGQYLSRISNIRGLETGLYSDTLKLAGTADCIADFDGMLSVIDFKTSRTMKKREWIEDYFIQVCAYAWMYQEHTRGRIDRGVVIMSAEDGRSGIFFTDPLQYKGKLLSRLDMYAKTHKSVNTA